MSTSSPYSPAIIQAIVTGLENGRIAIAAGVAAGALCTYDFFLTIGDEQRHMWARRKSLVFLLFVVLRYATLGYQLTFNLAFFLPINSNMGCAAIIYVEQALFILSSSALSGIFALRTFAIYRRNWYILAALMVVAAVKVFISAIDFFVSAQVTAQEGAFARFASCSSTMGANYTKWNTASSALALMFDTIVISLTVYRTARSAINTQRLGMQKNYSFYVLRDGLLYYLAIEILLLFTVIFNQVPALSIKVARVVIILQTSLAPILAQRLMLNLRTVDPTTSKLQTLSDVHTSTSTPETDTLEFAHGTIIGNIGAPLRTDGYSVEEPNEDAVYTPREYGNGEDMHALDDVRVFMRCEQELQQDESEAKEGNEGVQDITYLAV